MEQQNPNPKQLYTCFILCRMLTDLYRPLVIVRFDDRIDHVYILAGENLEVLIDVPGSWRVIR
jgi:hypothetical protein